MKIPVAIGLLSSLTAFQTPQAPPPDLRNTSWQLVRYLSSDNVSKSPGKSKRSEYTLSFGADGSLFVRADCDRGQGTWKTDYVPNRIFFSPVTMSRHCTSHYIHGRMVNDLTFVRSYVVDNGRLFLALMGDIGTYEFEPLSTAPVR